MMAPGRLISGVHREAATPERPGAPLNISTAARAAIPVSSASRLRHGETGPRSYGVGDHGIVPLIEDERVVAVASAGHRRHR